MLMPIQKILCPTDFSDPSDQALKVALELASFFKAKFCLAHIIPEVPRPAWVVENLEQYASEMADYEEELHRCAQQKLHEMLERVVPKGVEAYSVVDKGDAALGIIRIANRERAGLIVIATHGMTGWRQVSLGSVAERVVRLSDRPVLAIREPIPIR